MYTLEQVKLQMEVTELTNHPRLPIPRGVALIVKESVSKFKKLYKQQEKAEAANALSTMGQFATNGGDNGGDSGVGGAGGDYDPGYFD